jgi:signal recognition particle subunit SRP54
MFESLGSRLSGVFDRLRGRGHLTEKDVDEALREVRLALLEADVNFLVVKDFMAHVRERAVGSEVLESLTPGQHIVGIVNDELVRLLGGAAAKLTLAGKPPVVVMLVGLQGSGKTTAAAKLAVMLRKQGRRPLLAAADVQRPAAIEQLKTLGRETQIPVVGEVGRTALDNAADAVREANQTGADVVIVDTAGRLHIDEEMMDEAAALKAALKPSEILFVVDAMTGQEAVNVAKAFFERLAFDGVILTKLDGDARGGAALSIRQVVGRPVVLASVGERMDQLEQFYPDRMAGRILGMGDVMTLVEKARENVDEQRAAELEDKLRRAEFTLEDFLDQLEEMRRMGPIGELMNMIPGLSKAAGKQGLALDEKEFARIEAIIRSMTPAERREPQIISGSRRRRIADGSGTTTHDVNQLLKQFAQARKMLKSLGQTGKRGSRRMPQMPFGLG